MNINNLTIGGVTYENVPVDGLSELGISQERIASLVLHQTKIDMQAQLLELHANALRDMVGAKTLEENLTWTPKEMAAKALINGNASESERSLIVCEAEISGDDPIMLAKYIVGKKESSYPVIGKLSGFRRKSKRGIEEATTLAEVDEAYSEFSQNVATLKKSL